MSEIHLSATQAAALDDICRRHLSGLLTGPGGTGKSFLISEITSTLDKQGRKYSLTATTGIAAVLIGGITVHSQFRIFPDDLTEGGEEKNLQRIKNNRFLKAELSKIQTLIIDEASMLDVVLFERVHKILCMVHNCGAPFGGIQVVLVGDFFQLPPVSRGATKFIFETSLFWETCDSFWQLREVWRQTDVNFCNLLHRVRVGESTEEDFDVLASRVNADVGPIEPTKLFSKNVNVDKINLQKFNELEGETHSFHFRDGEWRDGRSSAEQDKFWQTSREKFRRDISVSDTIDLKIGTQVMLAFNLDVSNGLCNGTRGIIVGFQESKNPASEKVFHTHDKEARSLYLDGLLPVVQFDNGSKILIPFVRWTRNLGTGDIYYWNIPLRHAWASTIHRMQGQTLSLVDASLDSSVFEVGQAYVALSRCKSLEGLRLSSFDPSCIKVNDKVKDFYNTPFSLQKAEFLLPKQKKTKVEERVPSSFSFTVVDD
jgi:ATP-dependent DNA helicase PIF1